MADRGKHLKCDVGRARVSGGRGVAVAIDPSAAAARDDVDDLVWLDHVNAGLAFNDAAAWANIASCFRSATEHVLGVASSNRLWRSCPLGRHGTVGYVIPGEEPTDEPELVAYRILVEEIRRRQELQQELRDFGRAFAHWSGSHVYRKVQTDTGGEAAEHAGR